MNPDTVREAQPNDAEDMIRECETREIVRELLFVDRRAKFPINALEAIALRPHRHRFEICAEGPEERTKFLASWADPKLGLAMRSRPFAGTFRRALKCEERADLGLRAHQIG